MKRIRSGLAIATAATLALAAPSPASAGGWAVTTLDPLTQPVAGEEVEVGLTIRQHGVTPVALDDVAIVVTPQNGKPETFPAAPEGPVGHYVARVTFPENGQFSWRVEQGIFGPQELGVVDVASPGAVSDSTAWPDVWRLALPALAVVLLLAAVIDRRRRGVPVPV